MHILLWWSVGTFFLLQPEEKKYELIQPFERRAMSRANGSRPWLSLLLRTNHSTYNLVAVLLPMYAMPTVSAGRWSLRQQLQVLY